MLDTLWHLRGSLPLPPSLSDAEALDQVEGFLAAECKQVLGREADRLAFRSDMFRGERNAVLAFFNSGEFQITARSAAGERMLDYDLSARYGFLACVVFAMFAAGIGAIGDGLRGALIGAALALAWIYGMNRLTASIRVPHALSKVVLRGHEEWNDACQKP
ncbi:hypothetical protein [Novosphingobium sp. 9]|uniref:hypothetical protein n=1 Tax=Novosphingobium sp. 9 TaxID=2025349 RepID=UPI0021B5B546|nr:hypothetical protein [Novosphingobium sp. 9]